MKLSKRGYAYQSKVRQAVAYAIDRVGSFIFSYPQSESVPAKRILVIRIDSIGDVVITDPFLTCLKKENPNADIIFLTTNAGKQIFALRTADQGGPISELQAFDCKWFSKNTYRLFSELITLKKVIQSVRADKIIDLRGDVRNLFAARMAAPNAVIESFGITGGRFLLNRVFDYPQKGHAAERNFVFLKNKYTVADISLSQSLSSKPAEPFSDKQKTSGRIRIAIHPGAGTDAKKWSTARWAKLTELISHRSRYEIFWIGDASCVELMNDIRLKYRGKSTHDDFKLNRIPLESLGWSLAECDLLVSADSGPVHIAAAQKVPTIVLFSGTSLPEEWTPWKTKNLIIRKPVPCSPCYRTTCFQPRHDCMLDITPEEVFDAIEDMTMDML
ncbi:MAG: glycosyltransferase family 9 protein [Candidatus Omnitrophica bacterium]|nr:glycosyltransferase family 9 protein [Candidatus Omnitrophota bacterium]